MNDKNTQYYKQSSPTQAKNTDPDINDSTVINMNPENENTRTFRSNEEGLGANTQIQTEKREVTTFKSDGPTHLVTIPRGYVDTHHDISTSERNSITGILERPTHIVNTEWSSDIAAVSYTPADMSTIIPLIDADFPSSLFAANTQIRNKVSGFTYLTANIVFRLLVNALPFQAGKLLMVFRPFYTDSPNDRSKNHLSGLSGFPHVVVDASVGNDVQLEVPFKSFLKAWDLTDEQDLGRLQIFVLNPLKSAEAPTTCPVSLIANFSNVELTVPTSLAVNVPTSLRIRQRGPFMRVIGKRIQRKTRYISDSDYEIDYDVESDDSLPVAQVSDIIANRPATDLPLSKDDNSVPLALDKNNYNLDDEIIEDELSIANITKRENLLTSGNWSSSQTYAQQVLQVKVGPGACNFDGDLRFHTYLSYLTTLFYLWRGTLRYKFTVAKTAFHSGRLRISYIPSQSSSTIDSSNLQQTYNWIWDLRESSSITLDVQFARNLQAAYCFLSDIVVGPANPTSTLGRLSVTVINPLQHSSTVADNVDVNVWVSSPDMEFYGNYPNEVSVPVYRIPVAARRNPKAQALPKAQVLDVEDSNASKMTSDCANVLFPVEKTGKVYSQERIYSLAQLFQRSTYFAPFTTSANFDLDTGYFMEPLPLDDNTPSSVPYVSLLDRLASLYAFFSGSQNFKVLVNPATPNAYLIGSFGGTSRNSGGSVFATNNTFSFRDANLIQPTVLNPILEINTPYIDGYKQKLVANAYMEGRFTTLSVRHRQIDENTPIDSTCRILRSGGADFKFSYLIGAPVTYDFEHI